MLAGGGWKVTSCYAFANLFAISLAICSMTLSWLHSLLSQYFWLCICQMKIIVPALVFPRWAKNSSKIQILIQKKKSFGKWFSNLCHLCSHATSSLSKLTVFHLLYGSSPTGPWDSTLVPNMPVLYTARTAFQKYNHLTLLLKMPPKTSHRHSQN